MEVCPSSYRQNLFLDPIALHFLNLETSATRLPRFLLVEGSLEVKLPPICRDRKAEVGRVREEKSKSETIRDGESQNREDAGARKGRKVAIHCVVPMIWGSGGSKSNLATAAGAEPAGQMRDEKLHAVVARSTFPSQNVQNTSRLDHFWKLRCGKVHAVVARNTFPSQNVQNTPGPDHSWQLRCRKSAHHCGAKHISTSKCTKHLTFGPLLAVEMSKKCTPLWREAHFQVKMVKTLHVRTTF